jgi:hypothetical protein
MSAWEPPCIQGLCHCQMHLGAARGSPAPDRKPSAASGCATGCGDEATELVLGERQSPEHLEGAVRTRCASELEQCEGDRVWAVYVMHPAALIAGAGSGSQREALHAVTAVPIRVKLR